MKRTTSTKCKQNKIRSFKYDPKTATMHREKIKKERITYCASPVLLPKELKKI